METVTDFNFGGSKVTADGDCSHEIKRHLLLERKVMTNLVQFSSVTLSCPTLCDPMDCSTPGLPLHHQLPEFTQTHVHGVSDAIQPSHPLSFPLLLLSSILPSNDKSRWHIKKQRHYFADKGPYCQSYGFPSSHVQM